MGCTPVSDNLPRRVQSDHRGSTGEQSASATIKHRNGTRPHRRLSRHVQLHQVQPTGLSRSIPKVARATFPNPRRHVVLPRRRSRPPSRRTPRAWGSGPIKVKATGKSPSTAAKPESSNTHPRHRIPTTSHRRRGHCRRCMCSHYERRPVVCGRRQGHDRMPGRRPRLHSHTDIDQTVLGQRRSVAVLR